MKNYLIFSLVFSFMLLFAAASFAEGRGYNKEEKKEEAVKKEQKKDSNAHKHSEAGKKDKSLGFSKKPAVGTDAICPVTKEKFTITESTPYSEYKGKYYYYCCDACKPAFDKEPEKYIR